MTSSEREVLVFGREGQLAQSLKKKGLAANFIGRGEANFEHPTTLPELLDKYRPRVIVNCSAYTQVDAAENDRARAHTINALAPEAIATWCARNPATLIHLSTDYVYSGEGQDPWTENSPVMPRNEYGRSKLAGDQAVQKSGCHHYILRTSWLYGPYGHNFVKTVLRLGREREVLRVVADQIGSPTSTLDLADAILKLLRHSEFEKQQGVFHVANSGFTSWHEFASLIFSEARRQGAELKVRTVEAIPSSEYPTPAERPLNSRLSLTKLKQSFDIELQPWTAALKIALAALLGDT